MRERLYLDNAFNSCKLVVVVGSDCLAFGSVVGENAEQFNHFKLSDWDRIKSFVDKELGIEK